MINIIIIDDDPLVTSSLVTILESSTEITVLGFGHSETDAVSLYEKHQPDVALFDIQMGDGSGLSAASTILKLFPDARIILLTTFLDDDYIRLALQLGLKGYLIKQHFSAILPAVKAVANGQSVFGDAIANKMEQLFQSDKGHGTLSSITLSEREHQIMTCIAEGKNNKEISQELFLSEGTVRNYISQLLQRLECRDRTQLAIFYFTHMT